MCLVLSLRENSLYSAQLVDCWDFIYIVRVQSQEKPRPSIVGSTSTLLLAVEVSRMSCRPPSIGSGSASAYTVQPLASDHTTLFSY